MTARSLLLAALLTPAAALARPAVAVRLAFAPSFLEAADRLPMRDVVSSQIPLQLDAVWRLGAALDAGAYASYGPGFAGGCRGADCSASSVRAGLQVQRSFAATVAGGLPWLGAGAGWEWATVRRGPPGGEVTWRWSGPEGLVEAGLAWSLGRRVSLGPYLLLALGSYGEVSLDADGGAASSPVGDRSLHAWLHAGVRGRIDLSPGGER